MVAFERRLERRWGISTEVTQTTTALVSSRCSARRSCCIHCAESTSYRVCDGGGVTLASWASIVAVFRVSDRFSWTWKFCRLLTRLFPDFPLLRPKQHGRHLGQRHLDASGILFRSIRQAASRNLDSRLRRYLDMKKRAVRVLRRTLHR